MTVSDPTLSPAAQDAVRDLVLDMLDSVPSPDQDIPTTIKQMAYQVDKGRRVTFRPPGESGEITGYLAGWDTPSIKGPSFWSVLVPDDDAGRVEHHLIPRENTTLVLHREATFQDELLHKEMDDIVRSFRYFVVKKILKKSK